MKLSDRNPGAVAVLADLLKPQTPPIDPDSALGPMGVLLSLDAHGIYGPDIWDLSKGCSEGDRVRFCAALRAVQLGLHNETELMGAIKSRVPINWVAEVQGRLPNFGKVN
jgi:hypothetical protein